MPYVQVVSADKAVDTAKRLGCDVKLPPIDVRGVGRFAIFFEPLRSSRGLRLSGHDGGLYGAAEWSLRSQTTTPRIARSRARLEDDGYRAHVAKHLYYRLNVSRCHRSATVPMTSLRSRSSSCFATLEKTETR